jgi:hypothetical protein
MDSDSPVQQDSSTWGAPANTRWSTRQTLAAVGIAAVIAALGGAAIFAATSTESHAMGPGGRGPGQWGGPDGGPGGPGGPGAGRPGGPGDPGHAAPLHGEFVVSDGNGGYTTELTQNGVVTAVSDTSITAKSTDGFTQTYVLQTGAAKGQVAVNDTVNIQATKAGGQPTATTVVEGSEPGPGGPGGPGGRPPR